MRLMLGSAIFLDRQFGYILLFLLIGVIFGIFAFRTRRTQDIILRQPVEKLEAFYQSSSTARKIHEEAQKTKNKAAIGYWGMAVSFWAHCLFS